MAHRFYYSGALSEGLVNLDDSQVHHIRNVMRAKIGDQVELFDGRGQVSDAEIVEIKRQVVQLKSKTPQEKSTSLQTKISIAMPMPKSDRVRFLVEKLTEIGADRLVPITCQRSVFDAKSCSPEKLSRYSIEACKQCGRNNLLGIAETGQLADFIRESQANSKENVQRWIAALDGQPLGMLHKDNDEPKPHDAIVLIGPEGGFAENEIELACQNGFQKINLGQNILRMETAALVASAALSIY